MEAQLDGLADQTQVLPTLIVITYFQFQVSWLLRVEELRFTGTVAQLVV